MTNVTVTDDEFLAQVKTRLSSSIEERDMLDGEIESLVGRRDLLERQIASLRTLLDIEGGKSDDNRSQEQPLKRFEARARARTQTATADDVVDLLSQHGAPMHYKDIHTAIIERGIPIGGRGNADTLLSRYFKDTRLERTERGTYALVDRKG